MFDVDLVFSICCRVVWRNTLFRISHNIDVEQVYYYFRIISLYYYTIIALFITLNCFIAWNVTKEYF